MARIGVVSSKVLTKYDNWHPGFYLKDLSLQEEERRRVERLRQQIKALRTLRRLIAKNKKKAAQMRKDGEVLPL